MSIFNDTTRSFATALREELASIKAAREARELYPVQQPAAIVIPAPMNAGTQQPPETAPKSKIAMRVLHFLGRVISYLRRTPIMSLIYGQKEQALHQPPFVDALQQDLVGLSISGGGIRSATLSLGILQGLAARGLLKHIDYLSTVSGGGYIGSWLISWIRQDARDTHHAKAALAQVETALASDADNDVRPVRYLRRYSNYLTPDTSLLSADTWTLAAIWSRNTLLNLAIIVSGIAALLLLPRFAGYFLLPMSQGKYSAMFGVDTWVAGISLLCAALSIGSNLFQVGRGEPGMAAQSGVQLLIVVPLVIGSSAMAEWMLRVPTLVLHSWLLVPTIISAVLYAALAWTGGFSGCFVTQNKRSWPEWLLYPLGYALAAFASILAGLLTAIMLHGVALLVQQAQQVFPGWLHWAGLCVGPPLVLLVLALGMILQIGLMGHDLPDASREWLGRLRAWTMIYSFGWLLFTGISIYGPFVLYWAGSTASLSLGGVWGAISAIGLFGGKSEKTTGGSASEGIDWKGLCLDAITKIAPFVFILGFATLIALGIHELVIHPFASSTASAGTQPRTIPLAGPPDRVTLTVGEKPVPASTFRIRSEKYADDLNSVQIGRLSPGDFDFYNLGSLLLLVTAAGLLLSWRVDINDFSMHHFYKNRLVRCYLGASRPVTGEFRRKPDRFTAFDSRDDTPLAKFACPDQDQKIAFAKEDYCGPYPILNGALNLAGATPLAWQERKAASFAFTPLYCGYDKPQIENESDNPGAENYKVSKNAYAPTATFAYERGIDIGTAMGISGAAANPNAGYHTSPAVAFLMTIFNVRLGWWLGNPARYGKADNPGPTFGLTYLITELFGLANASRAYVNVSDGGHFENLGIYELVKRRCRYIIACDGEQDGGLQFGGLANAIRKCRTDFDVKIDIDVEQIRLKDGFSRAHCVVGKITYPEDADPGYLLYLKASLTGNEATDILQYHCVHPDFPHQSTADQWFDESQFESYRKLGLHIVNSTFALNSAFAVPDKLLEDWYSSAESYQKDKAHLFGRLWDVLYPPSPAIQKSFTKHADDYTKLVDAISKGQNTSYLDNTLFNKWLQFPPAAPNTREGRYLCADFLQLMENVYLDLQLDDPTQRDHPANFGWLTLFRQWAVSDPFMDAWRIAGDTYGKPFQEFYQGLVDKESSRVEGTWIPTVVPGPVPAGLTQIDLLVDHKSHKIRGAVTTSAGTIDVGGARFNGTDLTFALQIGAAGLVPYRMQLINDKKASLAPVAGGLVSTTLKKS
jgi:hypothetical protein